SSFVKVERIRLHGNGRLHCLPLPSLYYPLGSHKPFGSFKDIFGLVCALCQCAVTTFNYDFCGAHADNPIKISVWPIIFAFGLLCSKFLGNQ
ncbi:hypothetical protein CICLE_v10004000mg, partial [Citrus x clementina]